MLPTVLLLAVCAIASAKTRTQLSVHLATWNAGDEAPGRINLDPWLGVRGKDRPDVVAIGMEELDDESSWRNIIDSALRPKGYAKLAEQEMGAILEMIYVKEPLMPHISNVLTTYKGTGFLGLWHNKGGVSIRFDLGSHSFVFVTSHLAAGQDEVDDRIDDYEQTLKHHYFSHNKTPYIMDHDYVFWQGDLNFRVDGLPKNQVESMVATSLPALLKYDQLRIAMSSNKVFKGFQEAPIKFRPTYKFDKGTNRYDTSEKQRIPSWTDRILYRTNPSKQGLSVIPFDYQAFMEYTLSDHKPTSLTCAVIM